MALSLIGCAPSTKDLRRISLGMNKNDVVNSLGEPTAARGSIKNKYNQTIEVWEYVLCIPDDAGRIAEKSALTVLTFGFGAIAFAHKRERNYWLYFHDDILVQWGQAGDWKKEADRIYEVRFNTGSSITK